MKRSESARPRPVLAGAVRYTHLAIVLFTIVGFALPYRASWIIHALLVPTTQVHWHLNDGTCAMTTWERQLLAIESEHQSGSFVRDLVNGATGWMPPEKATRWAMNSWMWGTFAISVWRIFAEMSAQL